MASELLGKLSTRRSQVDSVSQTWESEPAASSADAAAPPSLLDGIALGAGDSVKEWLAKRLQEMPEDDPLRDALVDVVGNRDGRTPAHVPRQVSAEDAALLKQLVENVTGLQRKLEADRKGCSKAREDLDRRETELRALEERLEREREAQRLREEACVSYPQPQWLENIVGTVNVAVVGNSGVGKSLLINKLRRIKPHADGWAPVGVRETTFIPTMYTFAGERRVRLWDLPGAGTERFPQATYIQQMGLRYFDSVLIATAGRFTTTEIDISKELREHGVPYFMVRTKVDLDVWNNMEDNRMTEQDTVNLIRNDLLERGVVDPYLVSSRDTEKYDLVRLLVDAFPGLKERLDHTSFLFGPAEECWSDGWALPQLIPRLASAIQGQWTDLQSGAVFVVDGVDVHITLDQKTAVVQLVPEDDSKLWWMNGWYVTHESVSNARRTQELRWTPRDIRLNMKPYVWRWSE